MIKLFRHLFNSFNITNRKSSGQTHIYVRKNVYLFFSTSQYGVSGRKKKTIGSCKHPGTMQIQAKVLQSLTKYPKLRMISMPKLMNKEWNTAKLPRNSA